MSVTLSKSQFRKTGYSEQGPGRRLTVGAELGLSALKTLYLRLAICLLSCLLRILAFTAYGDSPAEIYEIPNNVYGDVVEITLEGKNIENSSVI
ncbi:hypothetical protein QL285_043887 [Trifolium repens]|nr:hypothetical protein QL285_043887 [Trifolium repens]